MRRLHVVGKHEKFVASGMYRVYAGDKPTGLVEHWSIHEVGGGAQFIRVDVDGRNFNDGSTLMEALRSPDGRFERVDEHIYNAQNSQPVKVSYTFFDEYIEILQTVDDGLQEVRVDMPPDYGVWMSSMLLNGLTVSQAARQNRPIPLFKPTFNNDDLVYSIDTPLELTYLGKKSLIIAGREITVTGYSWEDHHIGWLDQYETMLEFEAPERYVILTEYSRRPEPKTDV